MFDYQFKGAITEDASREEWQRVLEGAYSSDSEFMSQRHRRAAGDYPTFAEKDEAPELLVCKFDRFQNLMESLLVRFADARMVGLVRHPCGAIHSWLNAPKEFPPDADPLVHWRSGACKKAEFGDHFGFDDWLWTTRLFLRLERERPDQFRLMRYEDFVEDAAARTEELFAWLGLELGPQTREFVAASQSRSSSGVYSVFKSRTVKDRWRQELQPEIRDAILAELTGTELERFL